LREREKKSAETRRKTIGSRAFHLWWTHRSREHPQPRDPYHAYRTDLGKEARLHGDKPWQREPNRFDLEVVDFPIAPTGRVPRIPRKLFERIPVEIRERKPTAVGTALQNLAKKWAGKMSVPVPKVIEHPKVPALESGYISKMTPFTRQFLGSEVHIGTVGSSVMEGKIMVPEQVMGAFAHEFGHHVHATGEVLQTGRIAATYPFRVFTKEERLEREKKAWKAAEELRRTVPQSWLKAYALGTYRK